MSRMSRQLAAVALFAFALFARADSLRLIAPAQGTTLRGGSFAELRWSAAQLPPSAEEWEAFLSIDGGEYYAFRITPHLEIDLRHFTFIVPNVDTRDARILIRVGDEVRETPFEARGTFSITHDPKAELVLPPLLSFRRGEAARDGDPGVVAWVDGARNGAGITHHSSRTLPSPTIHPRITTVIAEPAEDAPTGDGRGVESPSLASTLPLTRNRLGRSTDPLPISDDLLLVCRRRNI